MRPLLFGLPFVVACQAPNGSKQPNAGDSSEPNESGQPDPGPDPYDVEIGPYQATIRWTEFGIPHVSAAETGSLGYGLGYAFSQDHYCTLIDQIVMVNGERSRYHGAGDGDINLNTDFGWKALGVKTYAEQGWFELDAEIQANLVGFSAGVNRYLEEVGVEGIADTRCAGAAWVRPITHIDLLTYYLAFGLNGSGGVFVDAIGSATPPSSAVIPPPPAAERTLARVHEPELGSNGWAIGADRSENGRGMLLSNTHFPAVGERKWYESHLTIPGVVDVYGASLMGVPLINIGFNRNVAWTHTVSSAPRFVVYLLELDADDPLVYNSRGTTKRMEEIDFSVEVLEEGGSVTTITRTLYRSDFGWVLNAPVVGWTPLNAFALMDANENNLQMLPTWWGMNKANSLAEFQEAQRQHLGIPWVHTIAASREGEAWYIDSAAVPNWSPEAEAAWRSYIDEEVLAGLFADYGVYVANAADPVFDWVQEDGARTPGLIPFDKMPQLTNTTFVYNANDNHWLTNPATPLEGYPMLYGSERSARSPRTRMNARILAQLGPDSASGPDDVMTLDELESAAFSGRGLIAEELLAEVRARCPSLAASPVEVTVGGTATSVDIAPACAALDAWGGTVRLDDPGAPLWREIVGSEVWAVEDVYDAGDLFSTPFDPEAAVDTPSTLAIGEAADARLATAIATAVVRLEAAGLSPTSTLRGAQWLTKGDTDHPVHGGTDLEGNTAIATWSGGASGTLLEEPGRPPVVNAFTDLSEGGYAVNYGNSWVMAMRFTEESVEARALLVYSQAEHPASPHFDDQTAIVGEERLRPIRFEEADIVADPGLTSLDLVLE